MNTHHFAASRYSGSVMRITVSAPAILAPVLSLPNIIPMPLQSRREPWNDAEWLFELKYDGFRALAYIQRDQCHFVSRNGNRFASFQPVADALGRALRGCSAILDGELACLDNQGHPVFNDLLYRRREPLFVAFDALWVDGEDLRHLPLVERKAKLRGLLRGCDGPVLYADHVEANGIALYERACELDLEGIVAKHRLAPYVSDREVSTWFKVRNRAYTQMIGRAEQFERDRHREPVPGWHSCVLAVAAALNAGTSSAVRVPRPTGAHKKACGHTQAFTTSDTTGAEWSSTLAVRVCW